MDKIRPRQQRRSTPSYHCASFRASDKRHRGNAAGRLNLAPEPALPASNRIPTRSTSPRDGTIFSSAGTRVACSQMQSWLRSANRASATASYGCERRTPSLVHCRPRMITPPSIVMQLKSPSTQRRDQRQDTVGLALQPSRAYDVTHTGFGGREKGPPENEEEGEGVNDG